MAVCGCESLLAGLFDGRLGDPDFRPIVDQDLVDGQHRNPDPGGRPEFFTPAYFHTPDGLADELGQAGFTGAAASAAGAPGCPPPPDRPAPHHPPDILFP